MESNEESEGDLDTGAEAEQERRLRKKQEATTKRYRGKQSLSQTAAYLMQSVDSKRSKRESDGKSLGCKASRLKALGSKA